jgi:hypothetical protein
MDEPFWIGIIIIALFIAAEMCGWLKDLHRQMEAKRKTAASKLIDSIPLVYDCEGRIKQDRSELVESMKKWRKEA